MGASQLIAEKVTVVGLQVHFHWEMIADFQGLRHHKETRVTSLTTLVNTRTKSLSNPDAHLFLTETESLFKIEWLS